MKLADLYLVFVTALIGMVRVFNSVRLRDGLARTIGLLARRFSKKRRAVEESLFQSFPTTSSEWRCRVLREVFASFWLDLFSIAPLPSEREALKEAEIHGEENLLEALRLGHGAILYESNAFGHRNIPKQILALRGYRLVQVHANNHLGGLVRGTEGAAYVGKLLRRVFLRWESLYTEDFVLLDSRNLLVAGRELKHRLGLNQLVCSAADGNLGERKLAVPFLHGRKAFATGMISLASSAGSPILPLFCLKEQECFHLFIEPPLPGIHSRDRDKDQQEVLAAYCALFESFVRRFPHQFRNWQSIKENIEGACSGPASNPDHAPVP